MIQMAYQGPNPTSLSTFRILLVILLFPVTLAAVLHVIGVVDEYFDRQKLLVSCKNFSGAKADEFLEGLLQMKTINSKIYDLELDKRTSKGSENEPERAKSLSLAKSGSEKTNASINESWNNIKPALFAIRDMRFKRPEWRLPYVDGVLWQAYLYGLR